MFVGRGHRSSFEDASTGSKGSNAAGDLQALIDRIHKDADVTREALEQAPYLDLKRDPFLQPAST